MTRDEADKRLQALPIERYCIDVEYVWRRSGESQIEVMVSVYEEELSFQVDRFKGPSLANVVEQAEAKFAPQQFAGDEISDSEKATVAA